jgi:hypothetical protein
MLILVPLLDFVVDGFTFRCYLRKLALVSTGIRPGLVTVALNFWHLICEVFVKKPRPSRRGFVRLRAETTRVTSHCRPQKSLNSLVRRANFAPSFDRAYANLAPRASYLMLPREHVSSKVSDPASRFSKRKESGPRFLLSASLVSR